MTASRELRRARPLSACALALALALAGCGDTLQTQPIPRNTLEGLIAAPFEVFWLGRSFHGLELTEASRDPSGAFTVQYGPCKQGGQATCLPPVRIVTSPDNSFLPGGAAASRRATIRGARGVLTPDGHTIVLATGRVIVGIYALSASLAAAAAQTAVPINDVGAPGAALPAPLPDSGYTRSPLPSQTPSPVAPVR
ncbi:MAG TPA: hypothetical protein VNZ05_03075 [Solirubrobacteraceae bacterium]|nr:hypothetical protein [Solirubrobacteraceae bacterium]